MRPVISGVVALGGFAYLDGEGPVSTQCPRVRPTRRSLGHAGSPRSGKNSHFKHSHMVIFYNETAVIRRHIRVPVALGTKRGLLRLWGVNGVFRHKVC